MLKNCLHRSHNGDKLTRKPNSPDKSHLSDLIKISLLSHRLASISYSDFFCFFVVRRSHFRLFLSTRKENIEMKYCKDRQGVVKSRFVVPNCSLYFRNFVLNYLKQIQMQFNSLLTTLTPFQRCMYEIIIPKKINNPRHWSEKGFQLAL